MAAAHPLMKWYDYVYFLRLGIGASFAVYESPAVSVKVTVGLDYQCIAWLLPHGGLSVVF